MNEFGGFLGWVTAVCYFIAVANYFVKRIFRKWIVKLPKESIVRTDYQKGMLLLVRYHRYFGMAAGGFVVAHLLWQINFARVSYSGIAATVLMAATAVMGIAVAYGHKTGVLKAHRPVSMVLLAAIVFHLLTKI